MSNDYEGTHYGSYLTIAFLASASSGYEPLRASIAFSTAFWAVFSSKPWTPVVPDFHIKLKNRPALVVQDIIFQLVNCCKR
jgi:hypothetical protein